MEGPLGEAAEARRCSCDPLGLRRALSPQEPKGSRQGVLPQGLRLQHPQPEVRLRFVPPEEGRVALNSRQNHRPQVA